MNLKQLGGPEYPWRHLPCILSFEMEHKIRTFSIILTFRLNWLGLKIRS